MTDTIQDYFTDTDNCKKDLLIARQMFGNTTTTKDQFDQMEKTLGLMYLYCPEDLQTVVLVTIEEAEARKQYLI